MSVSVYQSVSQIPNPSGWISVHDSQYTSGSPLNIPALTSVVLPCNKGGNLTASHLMSLNQWDNSTNTFFGEFLNAAYLIRISFTAIASANNQWISSKTTALGFTDLEESTTLIKGIGQPTQCVFSWPFAAGSPILVNIGGQIQITSSDPVQIYNIRIGFFRIST